MSMTMRRAARLLAWLGSSRDVRNDLNGGLVARAHRVRWKNAGWVTLLRRWVTNKRRAKGL